MDHVATLPTLDDLVAHVRAVLCGRDQLDPEQTPLSQSLVTRSGRPCGLFFHVQGPRSVKTYAVWAGEEQRVLFYDSQGVRFAQTRLTEGPDPRRLADDPARTASASTGPDRRAASRR
jgi:hypothetical protein